jgi:uncharacterized protein YndB with AHSA1/START domain
MRKPWVGIAVWLALAVAQPSFASAKVDRTQGTASDGTRYYSDSLVIAAPAAKLFAAFTSTAEYRKWGVPVSSVDFRVGGIIEASYDPKGHLGDPDNIKNMFVAYVPDRLLVFRNVQAPAQLPGREEYGKTVKVVEFASLGQGSTRVTISGVGFGAGPAFDKLLAFFAPGDAHMLEILSAFYGAK